MKDDNFKRCTNCVMDTSDPSLTFDGNGRCNRCHNYYENIVPDWHPDEQGVAMLEKKLEAVRAAGRGKKYDCIIGLSGGLDSSYVAYYAIEKLHLRALLLHVDAGWNTPISNANIKAVAEGLKADLVTYTVDWEEMKQLQLAFLRSGLPDADTPQDLAFFSTLYKYARQHKIKYILTGGNHSTECIREPMAWGTYFATDTTFVRDVFRKNGVGSLSKFPMLDILTYKIIYRFFYGVRVVKPLNCIPFFKEKAIEELKERFGWQPYPQKHYESWFTKFFEGYWLPQKFGFDKRKVYCSSLVLTGQMDRAEAVQRISHPEMNPQELEECINYVCRKLEISRQELDEMFHAPKRVFSDYKNKNSLIMLGATIMNLLGVEKRKFH